MYRFLKNDHVSGGVYVEQQTVTIEFRLLHPIAQNYVIRAYLADQASRSLSSVGVTEILGSSGHLSAHAGSAFDAVLLTQKNADTQEERLIAAAYLKEEWDVDALFSHLEDDPALSRAQTILDDLKAQTCTKEGGAAFIDEYMSQIAERLAACKPAGLALFEGFTFYKIEQFAPVVRLSALQYVLYERDVNYAFDAFGYYLFGIGPKNTMAITVLSKEGARPLLHMRDLCCTKEIGGIYYHTVFIELADDGQYFLLPESIEPKL